jgi:putative endonuclease
MRDGPTLVFVEVRARAKSRFGGAADSITTRKQARVILAARHYLARHGLDVPCRFDALLLDGDRLEWIKSAFDA